jgi:uncharacterized membrane protein
MNFHDAVELAGKTVDGIGVGVTVVGVLVALGRYAWWLAREGGRGDDYVATRRNVGRAVLLGLEILVAGDIVRTVAVTPSFTSVGVLSVIVLIRTFLSTSLESEITGRLPWQRADQTQRPIPESEQATTQG